VSALTILNTQIAADDAGRFCLNDLHRAAIASGKVNGKTKTPSAFLRSTSARELVAELRSEVDVQNLQNDPVRAERGGRVSGQAGGGGSMCVTNAAKALHQRPKDLFAWLSAHRWIYKRAGTAVWLGYQDRIQSGLVEHKTTTVERSDGTEKVIEQVLITAKGLDRLAKAFAVEVAA
jgi:phage antirepressor YoqD-like protein